MLRTFALVFISLISCVSLESKRELGIKYAEKGLWQNAIAHLEKYVQSNIDSYPAATSVYNNPSVKTNLDLREYNKFLEAVYYLLSSYLGQAGFNQIDIAERIIEIIEVDTSSREGKTQVAEKILSLFEGKTSEKLREYLFYLYKARRLAEKVLYGQENPSQTEDIFRELPDVINKGEEELYEVARMVNTLEYVYGEIVGWTTVVEGVKLEQIKYYVEKNRVKNPTPPSYCCIFWNQNTGKAEYPYLISSRGIDDLLVDLYRGIELIIHGTLIGGEDRSEEFSDFTTKYGEVVEDVWSTFSRNITKSCSKWSARLAETVNKLLSTSISKIIESFPAVSTYTVKAESGKGSGLWVCPEDSKIYRDFSRDLMCSYRTDANKIYEKYKDSVTKYMIPFYNHRITFQILFEIQKEGDIPLYIDCQKEKKEPTMVNRTVTVLLIMRSDSSQRDPERDVEEICSSEGFGELSDVNSFTEALLYAVEDKAIEAIKEIFDSRSEPKICRIN